MKKIKYLIPVLVLALVAALFAFADAPEEPEQQVYTIQGIASDITEEGILLVTEDLGEVLVKTDAETVVDAMFAYGKGDYLFVNYDGMMTRSIPAQITADLIRMYVLTGEVTEMYADESAMLVNTVTHGEVIVTVSEFLTGIDFTGERILVYFDGAMTMSIPAQVNASHIVSLSTIQGTVTDIADGFLTVNDGSSDWLVNCAAVTLPENLQTEDVIAVHFDGRVLPHEEGPTEIRAMELVQISR